MRTWYLIVLLVWMFTGFPFLLLGIGFAGDTLFTASGVVAVLTPPTDSLIVFLTWAFGWSLILVPVWTAPFAFRPRHRHRNP